MGVRYICLWISRSELLQNVSKWLNWLHMREYLMNLGMAYFQSGDKEKSKEVLVKAQRIAPDNRLVQETLEWIH